MKVIENPISGIKIIDLENYLDHRGFFSESYSRKDYENIGIKEDFIQDNHSRSKKNVLRGMHFTRKKKQSQLLTVISGHIFDVVVDLRKKSPTFGQWYGVELSDNGPRQIYMSHGFAHGFCVLSENADLHYKVSQQYDPNDNDGIFWNDQDVGIKWPIKDPIVSERDNNNKKLKFISPL